MQNTRYVAKCISGLTLLVCSYSAFAVDITEQDISLTDSRVPTQYLPIEKSTLGDSTSYTFVDKTSVKLHPYNNLIRTYTRITNYTPAVMTQDKDVSYHSVVSQEYVNCEKQEYAKGLITSYENYFGEENKISSNNLPKRWESVKQKNKEKQSLIIICSLPLTN